MTQDKTPPHIKLDERNHVRADAHVQSAGWEVVCHPIIVDK